ncbi:MAG: KilA-N domain-containing protein, partial [Kiritimatiellae bacterium]|nr:KilA-N domain-containing protein [Kiritimatiellia bacterium]
MKFEGEDYVCLTDMAKLKSDDAQQTISNWMRNRMTI